MKQRDTAVESDRLLDFKTTEEDIEYNIQMLTDSFLREIEAHMKMQNITSKSLAELIGTSPTFIAQLLARDRNPSWKTLAKIEKVLGFDFKVTVLAKTEKDTDKKAVIQKQQIKQRTVDTVTLADKMNQMETLLDQLEAAKGAQELKQVILLTVDLFKANPLDADKMADNLIQMVNQRMATEKTAPVLDTNTSISNKV